MSKPPKAPRDKGWDILSQMTQPDQSELESDIEMLLLRVYNGEYDRSASQTLADVKKRIVSLITAHTNAEIAKVPDRLEAEFDRHAQSIGLWGTEGLVLDTLARTGNLSSEQKVERDAMVTERRALAILHGAIQAERAKLKEVK